MVVNTKTAAVIVALFVFPGVALSQPLGNSQADEACRGDKSAPRCIEARQRQSRDAFGLAPIETHQAADEQVRRVFYVDGYGRDVLAIAFVRAAGRDPMVTVYYPMRDAARPGPLSALVSSALWTEIVAASRNFDRGYAPDASHPAPICMHSWTYMIDAAEPRQGYLPASVRQRTETSCEDGPGSAFAREAAEAAIGLFPHCAALDRTRYGHAAAMLAACPILHGDRMAAAQALNRAEAFRRTGSAAEAGLVYGHFAYDAVLDWAGTRNAGPGSAVDLWVSKVVAEGRPTVFFHAATGESQSRVRITGILARAVEVPGSEAGREDRASFEQIWVRDATGEFRVATMNVGPWTPSPPH
jgi:hypothetical protein